MPYNQIKQIIFLNKVLIYFIQAVTKDVYIYIFDPQNDHPK
jgi:hypothetical protein